MKLYGKQISGCQKLGMVEGKRVGVTTERALWWWNSLYINNCSSSYMNLYM